MQQLQQLEDLLLRVGALFDLRGVCVLTLGSLPKWHSAAIWNPRINTVLIRVIPISWKWETRKTLETRDTWWNLLKPYEITDDCEAKLFVYNWIVSWDCEMNNTHENRLRTCESNYCNPCKTLESNKHHEDHALGKYQKIRKGEEITATSAAPLAEHWVALHQNRQNDWEKKVPSQLSQHPLTIPRDLGKSQRSFSTRFRIRLYDDEHIKSQDVIVAWILSKFPFSIFLTDSGRGVGKMICRNLPIFTTWGVPKSTVPAGMRCGRTRASKLRWDACVESKTSKE